MEGFSYEETDLFFFFFFQVMRSEAESSKNWKKSILKSKESAKSRNSW